MQKQTFISKEEHLVGQIAFYCKGDPDNPWYDIVNNALERRGMENILELPNDNDYVELDTELLKLPKNRFNDMYKTLFAPEEFYEISNEDIYEKFEEEIQEIETDIEDSVYDLIQAEDKKILNQQNEDE